MRERTAQKRIGNSRGESMVMALVLLLVFMAIGAAVLAAGAGSAAASSARISDREAYYAARSVLEALDESMRAGKEGGLGAALQNEAYGEFIKSRTADSTVNAMALEKRELPFTLALADAPEGLTDMAGRLTYYGTVQNTEGADPLRASITAVINYDLSCRGKKYSMEARYDYSGFAVVEDVGGQRKPVWTGKWTVRGIG